IGVIWATPESFHWHHEISEAAPVSQKMAKKKPGHSRFIERRELPQPEMAEMADSHPFPNAYHG
ncbi:MAG: hypothetical protein Q8O23_02480, partial [Gallionella sp.]|nr:hypothetical protein [Gallionella sp.]